MSKVPVDGKMHDAVYVVMCTAGLHEMYGEWPVATFTNAMDAGEWCRRANEYGAWMVEMKERDWEESQQIDRAMYSETMMTEEEYCEAYRNEPSTQYDWATHGSPGQMDEWEEEFEKKYPGGDWDYYWARELSLMLNPYDDHAYWARNERRIEYKVVEILLNPKRPYFP